jgi:multiple sugar transport system permease protein
MIKFIQMLSALLLCFPFIMFAGYIEEVDGKTIIHVKVYQLPDPSKTDAFTRAECAAVKMFVEKFPGIFAKKYRKKYKANPVKYGNYNWDNVEIQLDQFSGIQVEGVETDLLAIAGGMAPDILYICFRKSDNYIRNGFLYPLDEYFKSMSKEQIDFRINKKLWPVIKRKGPKGKDHIWAMPYGGAVGKVLLYRKDLFDNNEIAYPDKNWTWNDMLSACKKITKPSKGIYGILLGQGKHESWYWMTFLWSAGGDAMSYNPEKNEWHCVFDSLGAVNALDFFVCLNTEKWIDKDGNIRRGYSHRDTSESYIKWERGEIGMMFAYIDEKLFSKINPELTGMCPVPLGPTGKRGGELNSRMMGLFSQIKEPAIRDAAWEYMFFYDSKEAAEIKTKIMVEGGLGQFINPKYLRMFGYSEFERLAPKGWAETFDIAIKTSRPEPYGKNSNYVYEMMTFPIHEAEQLALNEQLPEKKEERLKVLQDILKKACARANEEMIGIVTPEEKLKRRVTAWSVLTAIAVAFGLVFRKIFKIFSPPEQPGDGKKRKSAWGFRKHKWAYVLLLPAALLIFVWKYVPLLRGSAMAFFDYRLLGDSVWVGVDNFGDLLYDAYWWVSVWNALRYSFLVMSLTFLPPIILAIFLQEIPKGRLLFRTIYYLPAVVTGLVTVLLWKQFFDPSEMGMLNAIMLRVPAIGFILLGLFVCAIALLFANRLRFYGFYWGMGGFIFAGILLLFACSSPAMSIFFPNGKSIGNALLSLPARLLATRPEPFRWLSDPNTSMLSCVIPMVWAGMGPGCLIYLAALKGIPNDYYEAADIDGATFIDKILFIVLPHLKFLIIINFVGAFISSWYSATGNILVMTGGGAGTETAGLHIWYKAFTYLKFGPATAMAWMLGFILIGFTVHQLRMLSKVEFKATGNK